MGVNELVLFGAGAKSEGKRRREAIIKAGRRRGREVAEKAKRDGSKQKTEGGEKH